MDLPLLTIREFEEFKRTQERALEKQAVEYERRLTALNGEQDRIAKAAATAVRQDVYESNQKATDGRISSLEAAENRRSGGMRLIGALAATGFFAGVLALIGWIWQASHSSGTPQAVYYTPTTPTPAAPQAR